MEAAVQSATSRDKKLVDLERNTVDVQTQRGMTTDHGVAISDTDNWLRVVDGQHTGPSLLEDQAAREKVRTQYLNSELDATF
jgi:catalase